jgi:hypothetical protein
MRLLALAGLLIAATCFAQQPLVNPRQPASLPAQPPSAAPDSTITLPAGTRIPLTLSTPISSKARPGDKVEAETAFPVTLGTRVAIPVGTYVQGTIQSVKESGSSGPSVRMRFTRLLYANGYSVAIAGVNVPYQAPGFAAPAGFAGGHVPLNAAAGQSTITPQPIEKPNIGAFVALAIVGAVAMIVTTILFLRHRDVHRHILFESGWQFDMVLESPVTLDARRIP